MQAIARATSFDLYRLQSAINRLLDDPQRIMEVKRRIHPGDDIEYFDPAGNRVVQARLLKFQRTRVLVQNRDDHQEWSIPYCALNIHKAKTTITETVPAGLGRNQVAVGDTVGFCDLDGKERYGQVIRLNQKTVTLDCNGHKWRVAYSLLFQVLDLDVESVIEP